MSHILVAEDRIARLTQTRSLKSLRFYYFVVCPEEGIEGEGRGRGTTNTSSDGTNRAMRRRNYLCHDLRMWNQIQRSFSAAAQVCTTSVMEVFLELCIPHFILYHLLLLCVLPLTFFSFLFFSFFSFLFFLFFSFL